MHVCYDVWLGGVLSLSRLVKFDMDKDKTKIQGFRENLKSTGQSKFTIDEKEETAVSHTRSSSLYLYTTYFSLNHF